MMTAAEPSHVTTFITLVSHPVRWATAQAVMCGSSKAASLWPTTPFLSFVFTILIDEPAPAAMLLAILPLSVGLDFGRKHIRAGRTNCRSAETATPWRVMRNPRAG